MKSQISNFAYRTGRLKSKKHGGQAVITAVLFFMFTSLVITSGAYSVSYKESKNSRELVSSKKSFFLAESGVEDIAYRIIKSKNYDTSETLLLDDSTATISVLDTGGAKEITSTGAVSNLVRKVKSRLEISNSNGASFHYGVQVGDGGLIMENSSHVSGNVFSNGPIRGTSLNIITGDAISAGSGGSIRKIQSYGSSYAHNIYESVINEDAYYSAIDEDTYVGGTRYPNSSNQSTASLPITDAFVEQLENEASINVINSPCPYVINSEITIGPAKINCDLKIKNSPTVTVAGHIWVVGDIEIKDSPTITLASSLGNKSAAIIADNPSDRTSGSKIEMEDSAEFRNSGAEDAYFLLISQNNSSETGGSEKAILVSNYVSGKVLVNATHGEIQLKNSAYLREVSGRKVKLSNGSEVVYETGLANLIFTSGPSGGYGIESWKETE